MIITVNYSGPLPPPMSGPEIGGTPIAYRVLVWAHQAMAEVHNALAEIRARTDLEFYPLNLTYEGNPERLVNAGLLMVAARRFADAARWLALACCELDAPSLAKLRAETDPPANQWKE